MCIFSLVKNGLEALGPVGVLQCKTAKGEKRVRIVPSAMADAGQNGQVRWDLIRRGVVVRTRLAVTSNLGLSLEQAGRAYVGSCAVALFSRRKSWEHCLRRVRAGARQAVEVVFAD